MGTPKPCSLQEYISVRLSLSLFNVSLYVLFSLRLNNNVVVEAKSNGISL